MSRFVKRCLAVTIFLLPFTFQEVQAQPYQLPKRAVPQGRGLPSRNQPPRGVNLSTLIPHYSTIAGGMLHSCWIKRNGTLWCSGSNERGQLGVETSATPDAVLGIVGSAVPIRVSSVTNASEITMGIYNSCVRSTDGRVSCWGDNTGAFPPHNPREIPGVQSNIVEIASGGFHSCACKRDGTVWCWGHNQYGQLGYETPAERPDLQMSFTPQMVPGLRNVASVSLGLYHSFAINSDGTAYHWGWNRYGQLGDGTRVDKASPTLRLR